MGYLDYAGLQHLWDKLKEKFAPKSHNHDDRYYTESEMDGKLNSKVNNNEAGANDLLSKLTTSWTATPTDDTYFIRQDTGGTNRFGRVKFSTIWNYIKGKADGTYQPKGSYAASGHTHDDRYYTEAEVDGKLNSKVNNNEAGANDLLSKLTTSWTATPTDDTYFIRQDTGGTNRFGRVKFSTIWNYIKGKADGTYQPKGSYAASGHTHAYLPLGGGTMTGNITFSDIGNTNTSNRISWNGSTDGADIYYKTTAGDQGNLVLNLRDDSNCYLRIAQNGNFKSYFSPNDGNFHGDVNGTADVANVANFAKETYINRYKTVNLTDLDQNTWYPVTGTGIPYNGLRRFKCNVQLNSGSRPSWSTHSGGFTAVVDILEESSGWGITTMLGMVLVNDQYWINDYNKPPVGHQQLSYSSIPVWWLRGGGTYFLAADYDCTWTIRKSTYTNSGQSVSPTTTYPGVSVNRSTITANLNGNAKTATNATTATLVKHQGNVTAISGTATRTAGLQLYGACNNGYPMTYGNVICASNGKFGSEIALDCVGGDGKKGPGRMYYRNRSDWGTSKWSDWATVAYLTDKVAGANHADNGVTASGKTGAGIYYVRFGNGTQMCWGFYNESDHAGSTSFPVAFNNSQYSLSLTITVSSNNAPYITGRSTTGFSYARHGTAFNNIQWIAIGTWK